MNEKIRAMGQVLSRARDKLNDCTGIVKTLRAMVQLAEEQARNLKKQNTFLNQLAAKTIPRGLHCLSMQLTVDYYMLPLEQREFANKEKLVDTGLYHYALFSDNILAVSVVVNSTIQNALVLSALTLNPSRHPRLSVASFNECVLLTAGS